MFNKIKNVNNLLIPFVSKIVHEGGYVKFCKPLYYKGKLYILRL